MDVDDTADFLLSFKNHFEHSTIQKSTLKDTLQMDHDSQSILHDFEKLYQSYTQLSAELENQKRISNDAMDKVKRLQQLVDKQEKDRDAMHSKMVSCFQVIEKNKSIDSKLKAIENEKHDLLEKISEFENENANLKEKLKEGTVSMTELKIKCENLQQSAERVKSEMARALKEIKESKDRNNVIEQELKRLNEELEKMNKEKLRLEAKLETSKPSGNQQSLSSSSTTAVKVQDVNDLKKNSKTQNVKISQRRQQHQRFHHGEGLQREIGLPKYEPLVLSKDTSEEEEDPFKFR